MARARNIKPGFFSNEELVELPFEVRLLFIGLWTLADREGRLEDRPKRIKMAIFPADDVDVDGALNLLAGAGFITRYDAGGRACIAIPTWAKHQNPHHREPPSTVPAPDLPEALPDAAAQNPEAGPSPALGKPEAGPSPAVRIPDSGFLIPDSGPGGPAGAPARTHAHARDGEKPEFQILEPPPEVNRTAWADWVSHRRKRRRPISERAAHEQWRALSGLSPPQQAACIAHSIRNDYQGLFPEKFTHEPDRSERNPSADRSAAGRVRANVARDRAARAAAAADGNGVAAHELDVRPPLDVEFRRCS